MIKAKKASEGELLPTPDGIEVRLLYDYENAQIIVITLKPGAVLKKHTTPVDVAFYVLEGEGVVEIGDEEQKVCKDTLIESPANIPHGWRNESNSNLRFLVIKAPHP